MKVKLFGCMVLMGMLGHAQYYQRTGKNFGIYATGVPIASTTNGFKALNTNTVTLGAGLMKMPFPGISFSAGYGYSAFKNLTTRPSIFPLAAAHSVVGAVLFDKRIAKLQQKKVKGLCHYLSLGLLVGADYSYVFGNKTLQNKSYGEIGGQVGLSFCHVYGGAGKRSRSQTNHFDVFYRQVFTPAIQTIDNVKTQSYYRCELGVVFRLLRHQVYDFLK